MTLTVVLSLFLAGLQPPAKPFALMVGDPAPPIRVSAFLKGEPVTAFQKGAGVRHRLLGNLVRTPAGKASPSHRASEEITAIKCASWE